MADECDANNNRAERSVAARSHGFDDRDHAGGMSLQSLMVMASFAGTIDPSLSRAILVLTNLRLTWLRRESRDAR
ncbi:hypothetical protein [Acidiphilium sp.]|uniref:hypothetical protein n=1 Tax=Acidiphilium sp. TaxID=527 RepID=UPI003D08F904